MATGQAAIDDFAIEGRVRLPASHFEVPSGALEVAGASVKFAQSRVKEVVTLERRIQSGFVQGANARGRTFELCNDNRPVQQINGRAVKGNQGVVEPQNRGPVRFVETFRSAMM